MNKNLVIVYNNFCKYVFVLFANLFRRLNNKMQNYVCICKFISIKIHCFFNRAIYLFPLIHIFLTQNCTCSAVSYLTIFDCSELFLCSSFTCNWTNMCSKYVKKKIKKGSKYLEK